MQFQSYPVPFVLSSFKRHYSKVKKAFLMLEEDGSFSFSYKYDRESGVRAEIKIPNEEKATLFVVLMRRFLNPMDAISCRTVWAIVKKEFTDILPAENIADIERFIEELNKGVGVININGRNYSAENIYHIIANGDYFGKSDQEAEKLLKDLSGTPAGPYLMFEFYSYNVGVFHLASILLNLILTIEKSEKYSRLYGGEISTDKRCIFCMSDAGPFTSEEHIISESLGSYDTVLPEGYVCDICNNNVLSQLDNALVESDLLGLLRVYFVPFTKAGKFPKARYQNVSVERKGPTHIIFRDTTKRESLIVGQKREDGLTEFTLNMLGRKKFDAKLIGRALYKIGLEMLAFYQGRGVVYSNKYDTARAFVLKDCSFPNNLLISKHFIPTSQITSTYDVRWGGTSFQLNIYGVIFMFNLEEKPTLNLTEELVQLQFISFPLN